MDERLAKALSHPIRVQVIDALNRQPMSATQFFRLHPEFTYGQVYGAFGKLRKYGFLGEVGKETGGRRRGSTEIFYRATARSLFDESSWAALPESLRSKITATVFSTYIDRVAEAIEAGTMDRRADRHFTWTDPVFDQEAWDETIEEVEGIFQSLPVREAEAKERLARSHEKPIPVTVGLACFESPEMA